MRKSIRRNGQSFIKTTVEIEEKLYQAVKDQGIPLVDILRQAAFSIAYGNGNNEEHQIKQLEEEIQGLQSEISAKQVLLTHLQQKRQERISKMEDEQQLFKKYCIETKKKITPFIEHHRKPDYQALSSDWKKRYFQDNGMNTQKAEEICRMMIDNVFTFEEWLKLRNKELPSSIGGNN